MNESDISYCIYKSIDISPLKVVQDAIVSSIVKFQHTFFYCEYTLQGKKRYVSVSTTKTTLVFFFSLKNSACLLLYRNLLTLRTTQVKSTIRIAVQNGNG